MAQKILMLSTCDMDHEDDSPPTEGVVTVTFGYEGEQYSVELCEEHLNEYHGWMQGYLAHGARTGQMARRGKGSSARHSAARSEREDLSSIRAWARENGHAVSERGRISQSLKQAYAAAQ